MCRQSITHVGILHLTTSDRDDICRQYRMHVGMSHMHGIATHAGMSQQRVASITVWACLGLNWIGHHNCTTDFMRDSQSVSEIDVLRSQQPIRCHKHAHAPHHNCNSAHKFIACDRTSSGCISFCTAWHPMVTQSMLVCNAMAMQCSINHLHCECNAQSIDFCSAVVWMQCSINALATLCSAPSMICWLYTLNAIMLNQCSTLCQRMQCSINMLALHFECRQCPINANPTLWMQRSINALHLECNTQAMLKLGYSLNAMPMLNQWSTPWMQCSTDRDQLPCTRNATLNQWPTLTCDCESMLYCVLNALLMHSMLQNMYTAQSMLAPHFECNAQSMPLGYTLNATLSQCSTRWNKCDTQSMHTTQCFATHRWSDLCYTSNAMHDSTSNAMLCIQIGNALQKFSRAVHAIQWRQHHAVLSTQQS